MQSELPRCEWQKWPRQSVGVMGRLSHAPSRSSSSHSTKLFWTIGQTYIIKENEKNRKISIYISVLDSLY